GTLATLAHNPPEEATVTPGGPIERSRGELLLRGTLAALHTEAHALSHEIERIAALHAQTAAKNRELASARHALEADRLHLAELTARRLELTRRLRPEAPGGDARIAALGREANDVGDLIKRADAAAERRDKEGRARVAKTKAGAPTAEATDSTRPRELHPFDPPGSVLLMPVDGAIARGFGVTDAATASGAASQGLSLAALPGAEAVAPFDGRVVYAGPFRDLGLVLIIRHSSLYYSLLAGLQRVDVTADQWVLAGEPVGAMLGTDGSTLYFELRRDGHPVDPQPWLAPDGQGRDDGRDDGRHARRNEPDGDQKVRE
ncbi:MAG TPA: peptidoglycan DD-metalloendopeptidase family protein, partial [Stellaceae bacterium]|nr:peptidoglycan DD-metalloendopeptidase family protein [Stellaceae bacterium]